MQNEFNRWNNENESRNHSLEEASPVNNDGSILISKSTIIASIIIFIAICTGIICYANMSRSLSGAWIRYEDDAILQGMTIEVQKNGNVLQGVIVSMGEMTVPFQVGQVKWTEIKKTGIGKYAFYDLTCEGENSFHYDPGTIVVESGGNSITIDHETNNQQFTTGKNQYWSKVKD